MTTRTGRRSARQTSPVLDALRWAWAAVLSLVFIVAGLALVGGGVLFAVVGVQAVLAPDDGGHLVAGVLFAVLGLAAVVGGGFLLWFRRTLVLRLSGRKPPSLGGNDGGGYVGGGGFFGGGGNCGGSGGDGGGGSC